MKVLTHEEILETLDVSRKTLWNWRKSDDPPPVFKAGGKLKCFESELMDWLKRQQAKQAS